MSYRGTKKARKLWSERANAKKEALRENNRLPVVELPHHHMTITIERHATGEKSIFELYEGSRIDNYSVYVNGSAWGVKGITRIMEGIRKALPRFRAIEI